VQAHSESSQVEPTASSTEPSSQLENREPPASPQPAHTPKPLAPSRDRSWPALAWYKLVRYLTGTISAFYFNWRASGLENVPPAGGVLLVSNHASHLDVFFLGIPLTRPLNYMARSSLFKPLLGPLIRSVGGFPIEREGRGVAGFKETLKRLHAGSMVVMFPEGTRTRDGRMGPIKQGIAGLAGRAGCPILPVGIAGTFEALPRNRVIPRRHPIWIHYGKPIMPDEIADLPASAIALLIEARLHESLAVARRSLRTLLPTTGDDTESTLTLPEDRRDQERLTP